MIRRGIEKRIEILERNAMPEQGRPVHRVIFADEPVPTGLPPRSTIHRIVFVKPPAPSVDLSDEKARREFGR